MFLSPRLVPSALRARRKSEWENKMTMSSDIAERVETRVGKITLSGRYHTAPRQLEDDYAMTQEVLGTGYSGQVRKAQRKGQPNKTFAVKVLKLAHVADGMMEQLQSEVENFLTMDHPHITQLYDVYASKEELTMVMECMEGGELFHRLVQMKSFPEADAAEAVWQILLALNYIHSHGMVHRDIKLENFVYDKKGSSSLKLIDFGFSKMWNPKNKMEASVGTPAYVAPEVLNKNYTSQCDLWSLGVLAFTLLQGYMPFTGSEEVQTQNILRGRYTVKPEKWDVMSTEAVDFVTSLLAKNPGRRLTAQTALEHPWILKRHQADHKRFDEGVVRALWEFGRIPKFRRCCMEVMAWSLSEEQRAEVRKDFISIDANHQGTITLQELRSALEAIGVSDEQEVRQVFLALDSNQDQEIHYQDFLAAMVSTKIDLSEDLMHSAFRRFDMEDSGYITRKSLRNLLGDTFEGAKVEKLMNEADHIEKDRLSYLEFVNYLSKSPLDESPSPRRRSSVFNPVKDKVRSLLAFTRCGTGSLREME